jgi:hypothetical protein
MTSIDRNGITTKITHLYDAPPLLVAPQGTVDES